MCGNVVLSVYGSEIKGKSAGIYNRAKEDETKKDEAKEGEETGEWLQNLIQVMTYQELCQRRRENRSMGRKYY